MLSVSNWRMIRVRSAPSARRTAISRAASRRSRQQQVGDVDARDQQHEADRPLQHEQRRLHAADPLLVQRYGVDALPGIRFRVRLLQALRKVSSLARACSMTRRRAAARTYGSTAEPREGLTGFSRSGRHIAAVGMRTGVNPAGMTPMISWLSPLMRTTGPMTARSPPKRRVHSAVAEDHDARSIRDVVGLREGRARAPAACRRRRNSRRRPARRAAIREVRRRRRRSRSSPGCWSGWRRRRSAPSSRNAATVPSTPSPDRRARACPATQ